MPSEAPWLWQPPAGSRGAARLQLYNNKYTLTHARAHWAGAMQEAFCSAAEDACSEYATSCPVSSCYKVRLAQRANGEKESACVPQRAALPLT